MTLTQSKVMFTDQPGDLHQLFMAGVNAHDIEALLALYEPDSTAVDLGGNSLSGLDNLRAFLTGFLSVAREIEGGTRKVLVAGDMALMSSSWKVVLATPDGGTAIAMGTSAEVARRQPDGTWRFLIDDPQFVAVPVQ